MRRQGALPLYIALGPTRSRDRNRLPVRDQVFRHRAVYVRRYTSAVTLNIYDAAGHDRFRRQEVKRGVRSGAKQAQMEMRRRLVVTYRERSFVSPAAQRLIALLARSTTGERS